VIPGIGLVSSVKSKRMCLNGNRTPRGVRARTWCGGSSGKEDTNGCYDDSLTGAFTNNLVRVGDGTHKKGGQHGCEHKFIAFPEHICSENEKAWMEQISEGEYNIRMEIYIRSK
jgi:hypothetical protein